MEASAGPVAAQPVSARPLAPPRDLDEPRRRRPADEDRPRRRRDEDYDDDYDDDEDYDERQHLDSDEEEDDNVEQRLIRTSPAVDSFDVDALEIPGAQKNDIEVKHLI